MVCLSFCLRMHFRVLVSSSIPLAACTLRRVRVFNVTASVSGFSVLWKNIAQVSSYSRFFVDEADVLKFDDGSGR